jgi:hypothetical protein
MKSPPQSFAYYYNKIDDKDVEKNLIRARIWYRQKGENIYLVSGTPKRP